MGPAWEKTTVVVVSEFGRTFRENGSRGTDHGHGTVYWVAGGAVRGGRICGEQVAVEAGTLNQNRDYPVRNEYRAMLGGIFRRLYGLDEARLARYSPAPGAGSGADLGRLRRSRRDSCFATDNAIQLRYPTPQSFPRRRESSVS